MSTSSTSAQPAPSKTRAVFILFEGTGNDFREDSGTNVKRMLRLLRKDDEERQIVYYGEGLGRHNFASDNLSGGSQMTFAKQAMSLGIGASFPEHVLDAYRWLMNVHRKDDEIYVLGFSRGAYAAGCFCGLIEAIGLLPRENTQLISTGWELYAHSADEDFLRYRLSNPKFTDVWGHTRSFRTSFSKLVRIHFLGLWDTVASIGTDNEAPYLFPQHRGTVKHVFHAMALDEARNRFPVQRFNSVHRNLPPLWRAVHSSEKNFEEEIKKTIALTTEINEVWFPGNHTDVGGGGHNDVLLPTAAVLTTDSAVEENKLTIDVEDKLPKPALGYLSLRWMLRGLLQRKGPNTEILIDTLAAARADLELSYGLLRDTTSKDQAIWPAEHVQDLIRKSSREDRAKAHIPHAHILNAPLPEVELATLRSWSALEREPDQAPTLKSKVMPLFWSFREIMDGTSGERRHVLPEDKLHISVRTRWLASRLEEKDLELLLGVDGEEHCNDATCSNSRAACSSKGQSQSQLEAAHGGPIAPKTFMARAPNDLKWEVIKEYHLVHDDYYPMAHDGAEDHHADKAKRHKANDDNKTFWTEKIEALEKDYLNNYEI